MRALIACLIALLLAAEGAVARSYDYYQMGIVRRPPRKVEPGLMLKGGGGDVDEAFRWFLGKSGGGRVVVIRASGGDSYNPYLFLQLGGINSVETIVFNDRSASDDVDVIGSLSRADGIFIADGDKARYEALWKDTRVERTLNRHVADGKPLGGTNAGLAILGQFYFAGSADRPGDPGLASTDVLADPFHPRIVFGRDFLAFERLRGVITDTCFSERQRLGRLLVFLERLRVEQPRAVLRGIGVDERTALLIEGDGTARVVSSARGAVHLVVPPEAPVKLAAGQRAASGSFTVLTVHAGGTVDLRQWASPTAIITRPHLAGGTIIFP